MRTHNLHGARYGRLTVVDKGKTLNGTRWNCWCDCGTFATVETRNLNSGRTRSCGCLQREAAVCSGESRRKHGHTGKLGRSRAYLTWMSMKQQCLNPKAANYALYGGRGISICQRWRDSFPDFLADVGERPVGTSLDRIDTEGNYESGNVRWATPKEQANNRRKGA